MNSKSLEKGMQLSLACSFWLMMLLKEAAVCFLNIYLLI